jgi:mannose-6-phosphate isomerase
MVPRSIYLLPPNRVRRNYRGGAMLDLRESAANPVDGNRPEDWLASTTQARNPGLADIPGEGLAHIIAAAGTEYAVKEMFEKFPEHFLGAEHFQHLGAELGFLAKLLDSSMRLHVQAHPTAEFAQKHLNSKWGKFESYVILGVRENAEGYIRLGFQHLPSAEEWKRIVFEQDIAAMDACFDKIKVTPGEVWIVPGGIPHAIGEGLLVLEIMEPSDLVVRCEFEREGITVPPEARFMGRDPEFAMKIFDCANTAKEETYQRYQVTPELVMDNPDLTIEQIIGPEHTSCFNAFRVKINKASTVEYNGKIGLGIVTAGSGKISVGDEELELKTGSAFLIAASSNNIQCVPSGENMEAVICQPQF